MEMTAEQLVPASQQQTWDALNDPAMLKQCVPGCESIDPIGDNQYQVLMVARVGPVSAKFKGKLTLSDIQPPSSYSISFEGQGGAAGFAKGGAQVRLSPQGDAPRLRRQGERRRQARADRLAPDRRRGEIGRRRLLPQLQPEGGRAAWKEQPTRLKTTPQRIPRRISHPRRATRACLRYPMRRSCSLPAALSS